MTPGPQEVAAAFVEACGAELRALKPGNVHDLAAGHGMTTADLQESARVSAPALVDGSLGVGGRVLEAVRRTREATGQNTNLGILLLAAPLCAAALRPGPGDLRARLAAVLAGLGVDDAREAFRAIALASPAGLGSADRHDVRAPARAPLGVAMAAAAGRDRVARQYATGYADVLSLGVPRLLAGRARWPGTTWATTSAHLGFLAAFGDSHVARQHGPRAAAALRRRAAPLDRALLRARDPDPLRAPLLELDAELKDAGVNPGTSADLTVASLLALGLARDRPL